VELFIPGPINVDKATNMAQTKQLMGHRSDVFKELMKTCSEDLQKVLETNKRVLISTSSGSGLMEGAIRNLVSEKVLVCECGAFGKKWASIAKSCGKNVTVLSVPFGQAITSELLKEKLKEDSFEAVCITFNETSTGVQNPIEELAPIIKEAGALVLVDAVSALAGSKIEIDKLDIDFCLASSQKCFALPPGLAFASVSEQALEKAITVEGRGYYFDIVDLAKMYDTNQTPYTPAISLMFALKERLSQMLAEGMEARFNRHIKLKEITTAWAKENGFELFADQKYASNTITCVTNTKNIDMKTVKAKMLEKGFAIDAGYGKLNAKLNEEGKPTTFRIPHMGDLTIEELNEFLEVLKTTMDEVGELK
jgi:aspartate aminotransferase-like enzyme